MEKSSTDPEQQTSESLRKSLEYIEAHPGVVKDYDKIRRLLLSKIQVAEMRELNL